MSLPKSVSEWTPAGWCLGQWVALGETLRSLSLCEPRVLAQEAGWRVQAAMMGDWQVEDWQAEAGREVVELADAGHTVVGAVVGEVGTVVGTVRIVHRNRKARGTR